MKKAIGGAICALVLSLIGVLLGLYALGRAWRNLD